jgi:PBP1b-binding outer membrane lipoprotein LpoB
MRTKKNIFKLVPLLFTWLLIASCASTKVTVHPSDSEVTLSDFQTFDFFELMAEGDTSSNFQQNITSLKAEIIDEMQARGLKQSSDDPEIKINLGIMVEEKTQTRQTSLTDPGEWTYIGQRNYKWESKTVEVGTYREGSFTLHLVDSQTNEAIWVGIIEGILPTNPKKRKNTVDKAVTALFDKIDQSG